MLALLYDKKVRRKNAPGKALYKERYVKIILIEQKSTDAYRGGSEIDESLRSREDGKISL